MSDSDNYYRRRVEEEYGAAERAEDPAIAQIHREMARRYREKLSKESGAVHGHLARPAGGLVAEPGIIHA